MTYIDTFRGHLFSNKVFLLTGCTSGIGREAAVALSRFGARLVLVGRSSEKLFNLVHELTDPQIHMTVESDLSDLESILATFKDPKLDIPSLDGLFHCAGQGLIKPLSLTSLNDIKRVVHASFLSAPILISCLLKRKILVSGSSIVLMSSVSAYRGTSFMSLYSSAKGGIESFSKSLSLELAPKSIRVNTIVSGAIVTPMHQSLVAQLPPSSVTDYETKHPLGFGAPEDIVSILFFLLSPASRWITGSSVAVDGGYSVH